MAKYHEVKQGECLATIAEKYHFADYRTIYDHPKNRRLKQRRPNPNLLYPGDQVFIPDKQEKKESRGTAQRHRFQAPRDEVLFRLLVKDTLDRPCANARYKLKVAREVREATTNAQGLLEEMVPIDAEAGELSLWLDQGDAQARGPTYTFKLQLGHLDPVEEVSGAQARLNNLGFDCGGVSGVLGPETREALRAFQTAVGLSPGGELDDATRSKLRQMHDGD